MHDPKLSANMAHHQLLLPESVFDKLSNSQYIYRQGHLDNDNFYPIQGRNTETTQLFNGTFPQISFSSPEDILKFQSQRSRVALLHKLKEPRTPSEIWHYSGTRSIFSDVAAKYGHYDLLNARRQYELLQRDQTALCLPVNQNTLAQRFPRNDYVLSGSPRSNAVIKDFSSVSSSPAQQALSLSLSVLLSTRAADALSLSPLHASTNLPSSPAVNPDLLWADTLYQQQIVARRNLISSLSMPADMTLLEQLAFNRDRTFLPVVLPSSRTFSPPFWNPPLSLSTYHPALSPLMRTCTTQHESLGDVDHLLGQCISSSSDLSQHHLHHHLNRHHAVRDSIYNGNSNGSFVDCSTSTGKDLPTKSLKQDRMRHRQELPGALTTSMKNKERPSHLKKSASTQTQFSSFSCENLLPTHYFTTHDAITGDKLQSVSTPGHAYPLPPSPHLIQYIDSGLSSHNSINDPSLHQSSCLPSLSLSTSSRSSCNTRHTSSNHHIPKSISSSPPTAATPTSLPSLTEKITTSFPTPQSNPLYPSTSRSDSRSPRSRYSKMRTHLQPAPLNLSASTVMPISSITPPTRPSSTIDRDSRACGTGHKKSPNPEFSSKRIGSSHETETQVIDEAIEKHFRRSLGKRYFESSSPKIMAVHYPKQICSVDDHFARALGDQIWNEIKARTAEPTPLAFLSGTVDDHFSQALGAVMWNKLKAENKLIDVNSQTEQQPSQQHEERQPHQQQENQQRVPSAPPLQTPFVA